MRYASLPADKLASWGHINGVQLRGVKVTSSIKDKAGNDKGGGLVASQHHEAGNILLTVPKDLILSPAQVEEQAKSDRHLRDVLEAVEPSFSQNPRKKTMIFLLIQLTHSSPDFQGNKIGTSSPFTDYVQCLPKEIALPTFLSEDKIELLRGTSLFDALAQKLNSLEQEFDHLRKATEFIPWCQQCWWDEDNGMLEFQDWKLVDAIYRSRVLELPQSIGTAIIPVLDMANHAANTDWNARFETDTNGDVVLVVRDDTSIAPNEEITIMYGAGGACEMIFSYGFLDEEVSIAREIYLNLHMPEDDPLALAKLRFSQHPPNVRIYHDEDGSVKWKSPFVWWGCVNEEDGLAVDILQTNDGEKELQFSWKGNIMKPAVDIETLLQDDPQRDIFRLRATVLVQQRVELQGQELSSSQERVEELCQLSAASKLDPVLKLINKLREVEMNSLVACYRWLDSEKTRLMGTDAVRDFLASESTIRPEADIAEDFS